MLPLSSSLSARRAEDSNTSLRASTRTASPAHVVLSPSEAPGLAAASSSSSFLPFKAVDALSVSELRAGMEQFLRSSGALGSLKTQLRSVIVSELLKRKRPAQKGGTTGGRGCDVSNKEKESPGDGSKSEEEEEDLEDDGWTQRLSDALVESHLRHTGRSFSLAIFSSEADVSFGSSGDDALAGLLHLNSSVRSRRKVSLLQLILETHLQRVGDAHGRPPGYAVGTQTDNGDSEPSSQPSLELRLAAVDAKYALCFSRLRESTREEVDRRMAAYREELQMQMEQAYQQKLRVFEQQQLNEARRAAEDHYGVLLQHKMEEMRELERVNVQRIEAERARLGQARDDLELQRAELDRRYRDLHGLLEERDKAVAAMEGRLHDAKQQIRVLTTQARQYEELCGVRLAETDAARDREWRRVEDMRRLEAEHLAELQLKEEEMSRLRFRLKSILAAHGVTDWRGEGGEEKEKEREKAAHIKEALMRANAFQERVSAAYYAPPPPAAAADQQQQQQQEEEKELSGLRGLQSRETKWRSAWKLTEPTPPRSAEPKPVNRGGTAPEDPMMPPSVTSSVVVKEEEQQEDDRKNKKREVKDRHTLLASSSSFTPTSSVAKPLKMNTDSTELHNLPPDSKVAPSETSGGAIINREQEEEKRRSGANNERERSQSGDDNKKSDEIELAGSKRKPTSSHSLSSSQLSQTHSRHSTKSTPRNDAVAQSSSSSSSSSRSTSAKSSALEPSQESNQVTTPTTTTTTTATSAAAINTRLKEDQEATQNEEANERTLIETDEDAGRRGITWAAKSQYTVLLQRRTAEEKEESTIPGRGTFSLNTYMARAHQRQQEAENIMITRDSDDDDDDSDILFCRKGSSDESF